jgi:hypothetical protein
LQLIYDKTHQTYQWQLDDHVSSPKFSARNQALLWYDQLQKHFAIRNGLNKQNLPKLLTKF